MKIRVITGKYEYQGLYVGSEHDVEKYQHVTGLGEPKLLYYFIANGKSWHLFDDECEEVFPSPNEKLMDVISTDLKKEECRSSYCECEEGKCSGGKVDMRADEANKIKSKADSEKKTPIKSDGGSSTYYDIDIPAWLLYTLNERQREGKCYIKTEELIECGFSSDFDAGNIFKSLVRAWGALNGAGKAGNGVDYECNKIVYSANKLKQRNQRKEQK